MKELVIVEYNSIIDIEKKKVINHQPMIFIVKNTNDLDRILISN